MADPMEASQEPSFYYLVVMVVTDAANAADVGCREETEKNGNRS